MIKILICLIWGHKRTQDRFTGKHGSVYSKWLNENIQVQIMVRELAEVCPRCGKKLI